MHFDGLADRVDYGGQGTNGRFGTVELASAVVRDDECVGAALHGQPRIVHVLYAFEDERAAPALLDPFDVGPIER